MSDELENEDLNQNFWDEVDALRAMLEEDDSRQGRSQKPSFDLESQKSAPGSPQAVSARPDFSHQPDRPVPPDSAEFAPRSIPQQRQIPHMPSTPKKVKAHRRPSKAALIILYTIIIMELGALGAVAYSWYSWIQ